MNAKTRNPASHWHAGGYWSLEKRRSDLEKIESEWDRWLDAMQPVYSSLIQPSETNAAENNAAPAIDPLALKSLGRDLRVHADALHQQLLTWQREIGRTVIHGDFKTANLFFRNVHEGSREVSQVPPPSPPSPASLELQQCSSRSAHYSALIEVQGSRIPQHELWVLCSALHIEVFLICWE